MPHKLHTILDEYNRLNELDFDSALPYEDALYSALYQMTAGISAIVNVVNRDKFIDKDYLEEKIQYIQNGIHSLRQLPTEKSKGEI